MALDLSLYSSSCVISPVVFFFLTAEALTVEETSPDLRKNPSVDTVWLWCNNKPTEHKTAPDSYSLVTHS